MPAASRPINQAWLCWIALTPLLAAIWFSGADSKRRWLRDLALGYIAGIAFFWTVFSWLRTVTVPGLVLVGLYMAIYFALWSWICGLLRPSLRAPAVVSRWMRPPPDSPLFQADSAVASDSPQSRSPWLRSTNNLRLAFLLAAVWVAQEWLRSLVLTGWGWNTLGTALHGAADSHSNHGIHRRRRPFVPGRFYQCHSPDHGAPLHPGNSGPPDAAALRFDPDDGGNRWRDGIRPPRSPD